MIKPPSEAPFAPLPSSLVQVILVLIARPLLRSRYGSFQVSSFKFQVSFPQSAPRRSTLDARRSTLDARRSTLGLVPTL